MHVVGRWLLHIGISQDICQDLGIGIRLGFISAAVHMMVDMYVSPIILGNLFILAGLLTSANNIIEQDKNLLGFQAHRSIA